MCSEELKQKCRQQNELKAANSENTHCAGGPLSILCLFMFDVSINVVVGLFETIQFHNLIMVCVENLNLRNKLLYKVFINYRTSISFSPYIDV